MNFHSPLLTALLTITISLENPDAAPASARLRAEKIASYILGRAGIELVWQECAGACPSGEQGIDLRLRLSTSRPRNLHADTTGLAVLGPQPYAEVFWPLVEEAAATLDAGDWQVLGIALAHEIGHLLLKSGAHSHTGVMSARIGRREIGLAARGELLFSSEQAARMRAKSGKM